MSSMTMQYREEDKARLEIALGIPVGKKLFAVSVATGLVGYENHVVLFVIAGDEDEAFSILNNRYFDDFHRGFFRCYAAADVIEDYEGRAR